MTLFIADVTIQLQQQLTRSRIDEWIKDDLLRPGWIFLLLLFIACIIIWWKTVDKSRFPEIVLYTSIIIIFTLVLDELGEELSLWDYPIDIFPLFPPLTAINLSCLPFVYSLIFQHFRRWKSFLIATLIMASVFSFILEPIFGWIGVYQHFNWKSIYGFPIYIMMAVAGKAIVGKFRSDEFEKKKSESAGNSRIH